MTFNRTPLAARSRLRRATSSPRWAQWVRRSSAASWRSRWWSQEAARPRFVTNSSDARGQPQPPTRPGMPAGSSEGSPPHKVTGRDPCGNAARLKIMIARYAEKDYFVALSDYAGAGHPHRAHAQYRQRSPAPTYPICRLCSRVAVAQVPLWSTGRHFSHAGKAVGGRGGFAKADPTPCLQHRHRRPEKFT